MLSSLQFPTSYPTVRYASRGMKWRDDPRHGSCEPGFCLQCDAYEATYEVWEYYEPYDADHPIEGADAIQGQREAEAGGQERGTQAQGIT